MAVDKVKPLKFEDTISGTQFDIFPKETNPTEDYVAAKGIAIENRDDIRLEQRNDEAGYLDQNSQGFVPFNSFLNVLFQDLGLKIGQVTVIGSCMVVQDFENLIVMSDESFDEFNYISFEEC